MRLTSAAAVLVLVGMLGSPRDARAQSDSGFRPIRVGERVRVTTPAGRDAAVVGTVLRLERDTLHLRVYAESVALLPIQDVVVVEGSRGAVGNTKSTTRATVGGVLIGLGLGTLVFRRELVVSNSEGLQELAVLAIGAMGGIGALIGSTIDGASAALSSPENWVVLATPLPGMTLLPTPVLEGAARIAADSAGRASSIPIGVRVRVRRPSDAPELIGLTERVADSLHIVVEGRGPRALAWSDIQSLERESESYTDGPSPFPIFAGALGGWLFGPYVAYRTPFLCTPGTCPERRQLTMYGAALGAVIGTIWSRRQWRSEQWVRIPLPPP